MKFLITGWLLVLSVWMAAGADEDSFRIVVERYRQTLLAKQPAENSGQTTKSNVARWMTSLGKDGSWPDINYANQDRASWKVGQHLDRLRIMTRSLVATNDPLRGNAELEAAVLRGLDFWIAKRFQSLNWWWNQIGVPEAMRDIIVLLDDKLAGDRRAGALAVLAQAGRPKSGSGANTIWIADLGLQYGALIRDAQMVEDCSRAISGEIRITTEDGIQPDYSFHQHWARLQQFSYGLPYLTTASRLAWQLRGTPWSVPQDKVSLLADYALRGCQWMCRGIYTAPTTLDRSASRPGALALADLRVPLEQLRELLPDRASELGEFLARQNGQGKPLVGARTFPRSDFTAVHRPQFSFFLKTLSDRTLPTEVGLNSEHLKGALQGCGDHYLLQDGREYFNLAPVWDWNLLPGVTFAEGAGKPLRESFTGTVTDGADIATVMDYRFGSNDKTLLSAKRFWVCHGNVVVALIGNLTATNLDHPVRTAMDQCLLRGPVTIADGSGTPKIFLGSETNVSVQWVHHGGFAYAPLGGLKISIRAGTTEGSWKAINSALSAERVTAQVFLPVVEHGIAPAAQEAGFVIVAGDVAESGRIFKKPSWQVLRNDAEAQAVSFADGTLAAAFYQAGEAVGHGESLVTADKPCVVLMSGNRVWISDPTQQGGVTHLRVAGKLHAVNLPAEGATLEVQ